MEQFSLEKYLENPSRKVVTRRGNPVRIICTDRKHGEDELPVVFLEQCHNGEFLLACRKDGRSDTYDTPYDLFFADEEEKPQSIEELLSIIALQEIEYWRTHDKIIRQDFSERAKQILDLARKELLKDLPKWKKATENKDFDNHVLLFEDENRVVLTEEIYKNEYYIELYNLKNLPKEE